MFKKNFILLKILENTHEEIFNNLGGDETFLLVTQNPEAIKEKVEIKIMKNTCNAKKVKKEKNIFGTSQGLNFKVIKKCE